MFNNLSEQIRGCFEHAEDCARKAAGQNDLTLKQDFLHMQRRWLADADLLAIRQSARKESTQLLASMSRDRAILSNVDSVLLSNSRALIAESKRLLARLDERAAWPHGSDAVHREVITISGVTPDEPIAPAARAQADGNPENLSIRIFENGSGYGWIFRNHANEMLARGTAETEHKARIAAFHAAMIYIDRLKGRSAPKDFLTLH
jgi:hypothetical protein